MSRVHHLLPRRRRVTRQGADIAGAATAVRPSDLRPSDLHAVDLHAVELHTGDSSGDDLRAVAPGEGTSGRGGLTLDIHGAGRYTIAEADGRPVARIRGDYVIGFTAHYLGTVRRFGTLDEARMAVEQVVAQPVAVLV